MTGLPFQRSLGQRAGEQLQQPRVDLSAGVAITLTEPFERLQFRSLEGGPDQQGTVLGVDLGAAEQQHGQNEQKPANQKRTASKEKSSVMFSRVNLRTLL